MAKTPNISRAAKIMKIKLNGYYQALMKNSRNDYLIVHTFDYSLKNVMSYRKVCGNCVEQWLMTALNNECLEIYDVMLLPMNLRSLINKGAPDKGLKKTKAT